MIDALDECDPIRRHLLLAVLDEIPRDSGSIENVMVLGHDDGNFL
jgi:hypothetical protein